MKVIQFSPGRSGSTLVWNLLRELGCNPMKTHMLHYSANTKIVSTIRDPRDMLKSRLLITEKEINKNLIDQEIKLMIQYGLGTLADIFMKPNVLLLQYERFFNDYNYIFDSLEQFLQLEINETKRKELIEKYDRTQMKKISQNYKHFSKYDKHTHIHGNHISNSYGPGGWEDIIPKEYHTYINDTLKKYIVLFQYEETE